jgi:hypothetical protein
VVGLARELCRDSKNEKFSKQTHERHETQETHMAIFCIPLFSFALSCRSGCEAARQIIRKISKYEGHQRHQAHQAHQRQGSDQPFSSASDREEYYVDLW